MSDRPHEGKPPWVRRTVPPAIAGRSGSWLRVLDMGARGIEALFEIMVRRCAKHGNWRSDERGPRDDRLSKGRNGAPPGIGRLTIDVWHLSPFSTPPPAAPPHRYRGTAT